MEINSTVNPGDPPLFETYCDRGTGQRDPCPAIISLLRTCLLDSEGLAGVSLPSSFISHRIGKRNEIGNGKLRGVVFRKRNSFCIMFSYFMMNSRGFDLSIREEVKREFIYFYVLFFNLDSLELHNSEVKFSLVKDWVGRGLGKYFS